MTEDTYYRNFCIPAHHGIHIPKIVQLIKKYNGNFVKEIHANASIFYSTFYSENQIIQFSVELDALIPDLYKYQIIN